LDEFQRTIELASELGDIVPLTELVARHDAGRSTARMVAITCDDAYAGLLYDAGEYLRRVAVPLTVFVVTQPARNGSAYWWDRIDEVFPRIAAARWRRFEEACGLPDTYRRGQPAHFGPLRPFRQWILAQFQGRWPDRLEAELATLEQETSHATVQRSMTFAELETLAAQAPVTFGVHTVTHPVLPLLSDGEKEAEIAGCHAELRERLASSVPILAAPFGLFDAATIRVARAAGMTATLTLGATTLARSVPRGGIPRFCLAAAVKPWRTALQLTGIVERVRSARGAEEVYPVLPSPTT